MYTFRQEDLWNMAGWIAKYSHVWSLPPQKPYSSNDKPTPLCFHTCQKMLGISWKCLVNKYNFLHTTPCNKCEWQGQIEACFYWMFGNVLICWPTFPGFTKKILNLAQNNIFPVWMNAQIHRSNLFLVTGRCPSIHLPVFLKEPFINVWSATGRVSVIGTTWVIEGVTSGSWHL